MCIRCASDSNSVSCERWNRIGCAFDAHCGVHVSSPLESMKWRKAYNQRIRDVEHAFFTTSVLSACGGLAKTCLCSTKRKFLCLLANGTSLIATLSIGWDAGSPSVSYLLPSNACAGHVILWTCNKIWWPSWPGCCWGRHPGVVIDCFLIFFQYLLIYSLIIHANSLAQRSFFREITGNNLCITTRNIT